MEAFCRDTDVRFERCGKVVVATDEAEIERLEALGDRAKANGVESEMIDRDRLVELEPACAGRAALHDTQEAAWRSSGSTDARWW